MYDLVVIGGGINGAAIARDGALRKLKVVLLEKKDFGSGASTKTSKLAHGGVRYLEHFQFSLVRESLKERALLLKNAPHLVKPLPFLLPVYSQDPHPLWKINLGLSLYDYFARNGRLPKHSKISAESLLKQVDGLKGEGLSGGCCYYDLLMLDNRILIENILSAEQAGAKVYNYTEVVGLINDQDRVIGVNFVNSLTGSNGSFYGKAIVNATGAWSTFVSEMEPNVSSHNLAPTKGVHLIVPKIVSNVALLLRAPQDGRVFFVLPWEGDSLVGTTDTFYQGNPDKLSIDSEDCAYLLNALNAFFPDKHFTQSSILSSFVGLRPLVASNRITSASDVAREHAIQVSKGGLISVLGGKYTTHRLIAEQVVDKVVMKLSSKQAFLPCETKKKALPGASGIYCLAEVQEKLTAAGLSTDLIEHFLNTYGTASLDILEIMIQHIDEAEMICKHHPHVFAELTYSVKVEHLKKLTDWFSRRSTIVYCSCQGLECIERVARKLADLLNWTSNQLSFEIADYRSSLPKIGNNFI